MEVIFNYDQILSLILLCLWLLFFITKPEVRREMLILSIFSVVILPVTFAFNSITIDQVNQSINQVNLTNIIFLASTAGLAGVIYHATAGKHYHQLPKIVRKELKKDESHAQMWVMRLFLTLLFLAWGVTLLVFFFGTSIPGGFFISSIVLTTYVLSHRKDLMLDAVWSGLLMALVVFIAGTLTGLFVENTSTIIYTTSINTFLGVPNSLLLWSFAVGLGLGPLYEYLRRVEVS